MKNEWHTKSPTKSIENANFQNTFTPPFAIPESWVWVRLGDLVEIISGTSYAKDDITSKEGIRILRGGNINKTSHKLELFSNDIKVSSYLFNNEKHIQQGDIVITSTNDISNIAKSAFVETKIENTQIGAFLRIIRCVYKDFFMDKYIFYIFISALYEKYIQSCVSGTVTSLLNIKNEYLENFLIPLPPSQEQKEIVKILDSLFTLAKGLRVK